MFIPKVVIDWFVTLKDSAETQATVSKFAIESVTKDNIALRAEANTLKEQNITLRIQSDWMRNKINQLEVERALLLEKAYGIHVPIPELARLENRIKDGFDLQALFTDPEETPVAENN